MKRPAIKRFFEDIRAGKIDMIVVYKITCLTHSLKDFSKMIELFDEYLLSLMSIMGRLTLNILLSFAQFEREVSRKHIRNKISASKKKGMWIGLTIAFNL